MNNSDTAKCECMVCVICGLHIIIMPNNILGFFLRLSFLKTKIHFRFLSVYYFVIPFVVSSKLYYTFAMRFYCALCAFGCKEIQKQHSQKRTFTHMQSEKEHVIEMVLVACNTMAEKEMVKWRQTRNGIISTFHMYGPMVPWLDKFPLKETTIYHDKQSIYKHPARKHWKIACFLETKSDKIKCIENRKNIAAQFYNMATVNTHISR